MVYYLVALADLYKVIKKEIWIIYFEGLNSTYKDHIRDAHVVL